MFLIEYIKKYKVTYISVVLVFIVGAIIGMFVTFNISQNEKNEISAYVTQTAQKISKQNMDMKYIFKERILSNIKSLGIVWILGCTVIAGFTIYFYMLYKGFLFGYIITIIVWVLGWKLGIKFLLPTIILKNIIFMPVIFLVATSGIRMYKGIIKKEINIKRELIRHSTVMGLCIIFTIIVSCIDAYFEVISLHFL